MARIRTIKPEFWTDGKIVQLPFEARLLFIGLFNFVDDHGYGWMDFDRIEMQIFPADPMGEKLWAMMDLLEAAGLIQIWVSDPENDFFFRIPNWEKHQKVDKPGKCRFPRESSRRVSIPSEVRRAIGIKYGLTPGASKNIECYYCGSEGWISWTQRRNSSPGYVLTSLTFDHVIPISLDGQNSVENVVLCCKSCNSSKGIGDFTRFVESSREKILENSRRLATEKEREKEKEPEERKIKSTLPRKLASAAEPSVSTLIVRYCDLWKSRYNSPKSPPITGKDANILKNISKNFGHDRTRMMIEAYLQMPDQWFVTKTHDIPTMNAHLNKIALFADSGRMISRAETRQLDNAVAQQSMLNALDRGEI